MSSSLRRRRTQHSQSFHNQSSFQMQQNDCLLIQEEVDSYQKKLEYNKRKAYHLQDTLSQMQKENKEKKTLLEKLQLENKTSKQKRAQCHITFIKKQVNNNMVTYNSTIGDINKLRQEIGELRKERKKYKDTLDNAYDKLQRNKQEQDYLLRSLEANQQGSMIAQSKMIELKQIADQQQSKHQKQMQFMEMQQKEEQYKKMTASKWSTRDNPELNDDETSDLITHNEYGSILKKRCQQTYRQNREKLGLLSNYMRNGQILTECFETMKQQSGIFDLEEILKLHISSEDQNRQLQNYLYQIEAEIREKKEIEQVQKKRIAKLQSQIEKIKHMAENGEQMDLVQDGEDQIKEKQEYIQQFSDKLKEISPMFEELSKSLTNSLFGNKNQGHQPEIYLKTSNISQNIAEIDDYLNGVLRYNAEKNPKVQNKIQTLNLLDKIPIKKFEKMHKNYGLNGLLQESEKNEEGIDREFLEQVVKIQQQQRQSSAQNNKASQQSLLSRQQQEFLEQQQQEQEQEGEEDQEHPQSIQASNLHENQSQSEQQQQQNESLVQQQELENQ